MIWLMVGVPRVTSIQDPKPVESGMTRATWSLFVALNSFHLNPYDDVTQGALMVEPLS